MIFILNGATFASTIGNIPNISNYIGSVGTGGTGGSTEPIDVTLTFNYSPAAATLTLTYNDGTSNQTKTDTGDGTYQLTVKSGTSISWTLKADGYTDKSGTISMPAWNKTETQSLVSTGGGGSEGGGTPVNPPSGTTVNLTSSNTNSNYNDTANHLIDSQVAGSALGKSNIGTKGIYGWDIPANALVSLTVSGGGNYGMAITDTNDIVIEGFNSSTVGGATGSQGTYTFSPVLQASRLYVSTTKFVSASYIILTEEELKDYDFNIMMVTTSEVGMYISASQTVGSPVQTAEMGGTYYMVSHEIPANTITTINVKTGGNYGMCIADLDGNVLENKPSNQADADGNIVFSKQTAPYKVWVSKTKFNSAKYKFA